MNQTILVAHILGLALLLQLHMEIYVYKKKKTRQCASIKRAKENSSQKLYHKIG